jgi:predicted NACHT family NTPase
MEKLKVFISSKMAELRDVREVVAKALDDRGIEAWVYEAHAGARPEDVVETSLSEVETADIYVGLFWQKYGEVTVQEYRHARALDKPCFVYIRDKDIQREKALEDFLESEVYDLEKGVTYDYFDSAIELGEQVADNIMAWLVRRHREMTAEIQAARVSQDEIARLQAEVDRLQAASRERLPQGTPSDYLAQQMQTWFETLDYHFESHEVRAEDYFEWVINVPARRGYDRILVRGIEGEAEMSDVAALRQAVDEQETDEGWLVATRRKSQAACEEVEKRENRDLFCYTFDELLDERADFSGYLDWLEAEVKQRGIATLYVPLACTKEEFDPDTGQKVGESRYDEHNGWIDGYIDRWLDDPSKEHISILGEFGTGKTWFALHYAWTALQRYRQAKERGIERPRLPIVIPLRDYAKAVSVESLFSEFFFRKHEIPLPGYSAFEQLNRMGKLLLIFDGFDEMAAKVDRQRMINNFWELARVVVPGAKAILNCRTEHFPEAKEGRTLLSAELQASTAKLTGEPPQFEVLELEKFDDGQIRQVLSLRAEPAAVKQVMDNPDLLDLARRPVMTEFILEALPDIEAGKPVDLSRVYLYAVRRKMERDIKAERTFTSLADKLYFLCELSWEMLSAEQMSLNYRLFPDRLRRLFGYAVQEQKDLDHWHYDMMGQTMLVRNADGDYTPAHRSLLEFFVAYKFAAELGVLAADFTEVDRAQSYLDGNATPQNYTWSSYFRREMDEGGAVRPIPPLRGFVTEEMHKLAETLGKEPLTRAVLDLIHHMLDLDEEVVKARLLATIEGTRGKTSEEVGVTGGNVTTLLVRRDPLALKGRNLSTANLSHADFGNADLSDCNLRSANLESAQFRGTTLANTDLREANLTSAQFHDMGEVLSVAFSPDGTMLASGGKDTKVHIWDVATGTEWHSLEGHTGAVTSVCWSADGTVIASAGKDGYVILWNRSTGEQVSEIRTGAVVTDLCFGSDSALLAARGADPGAIIQINAHEGCPSRNERFTVKIVEYDSVAYFDGRVQISYYIDREVPESKANRNNSIVNFFKVIRTHNIFFLGDSQSVDANHVLGIAAVSRNSCILVFNCKSETAWPSELSVDMAVRCLALNPYGYLMATGSANGMIKLWDVRPFVTHVREPLTEMMEDTPAVLFAISDDPATWPEWWQKCKIDVPERMVPNPDFGKCLRTIEQKLNCRGLQLAGAKGLNAPAPDGEGILGEWLAARGAVWQRR